MERELWPEVYRIIDEEGKRQRRRKYCQFSDARVLEVYFWSVIHDRPVCWACDRRNWPAGQRWRRLPSASRMSERLATLPTRLLMAAVMARLNQAGQKSPVLVRRLDSKPLAVGCHSKDRDARWGQAAIAKARGYKLYCGWGNKVVPDAWTLGPMNYSDPRAGVELVEQLAGARPMAGPAPAYVLGDASHDSNPLHKACDARGVQLVSPRKKPRTGLAKRRHERGRLRSIEMLEWPVERCLGPSPFARDLYALRGEIERDYGNLTSFGGGLQPLPSWVRRPHRVALWVAAKLVINGVRRCKLKRLAA